MARDTDPNTPVTVVVGLVGAVLLFVIIVLLQALFYGAERGELARKVRGAGWDDLAGLRTEQEGLLHSTRWIDEKKGVVGIPIERAMELLVARGAADRRAPSPVRDSESAPGR